MCSASVTLIGGATCNSAFEPLAEALVLLDFTTSTVVNSSEIESYDLNLKSSRTGEREDKSLRRQETLIKFHFETLVSTALIINSSKEWDSSGL